MKKNFNAPHCLMQRNLQALRILPLFMIALWLFPALSHAHKIRVFAWTAGDTVTVESSFSGGRPLVHGTVEVQDAATGITLLQGKTNEKGIFTFSLTETDQHKSTELRIIVSGGEGHRNEWLLPTESARHDSEQKSSHTKESTPAPDKISSGHNSTEELTGILDQLLEEKLAPIRRSLAQAENQQPGLSDILGGIGYLIGIAGIIAWMKSKK
ncbi:MAG: hypothetical protein ABIJ50_12290 [Pseudomonadota bacterium]